jgi:hypothetical protein
VIGCSRRPKNGVVPAKAGTHNHRPLLMRHKRRQLTLPAATEVTEYGSRLALARARLSGTTIHDSNVKQQTHMRILAAGGARGLRFVVPPKGGSRECRMRAAPAVPCAKGRKKIAHEHTGQRRRSDIPCAMALRLISRSSRGIGLSCPRRLTETGTSARSGFAPPKDLTPTIEASDPHDFAVRISTARQHVLRPLTEFTPPCDPIARTMPPRPPHPIPTFGDDGQRPFLGDRMA